MARGYYLGGRPRRTELAIAGKWFERGDSGGNLTNKMALPAANKAVLVIVLGHGW